MSDPTPADNLNGQFLRIGTTADFEPGSSRELRFLGRTIRIERNEAGSFSAIDLVCRHQNMSLAAGSVESTPEGPVVTCPGHGWRYNLTNGECLTEPWARLRRREVRVQDGSVYLALQPIPE